MNVIIAGSEVNEHWQFRKGLEDGSEEKWEILKCITNRFDSYHKFTRYIKFFIYPLSLIGGGIKKFAHGNSFLV